MLNLHESMAGQGLEPATPGFAVRHAHNSLGSPAEVRCGGVGWAFHKQLGHGDKFIVTSERLEEHRIEPITLSLEGLYISYCITTIPKSVEQMRWVFDDN